MKSILKLGIVLLVVGLAVSAFAATHAYIRINNDVTVNGNKLAAGEYKVMVDGKGPDVKVTFVQGKQVKATVDGKIAKDDTGNGYDSVVYSKANDATIISEIYFSKLKSTVKFE